MMPDLTPAFIDPGQSYLLALSGGMDSMVMAFWLHLHQIRFEAAHVNYQLRGEASALDEAFVRNWCTEHNILLHVKQPEPGWLGDEVKTGVQEKARQLRYQYFETLRSQRKLHRIITAHHADDAVETMIFRLLRGTGLQGLTGIPSKAGPVIRPLIHHTRETITAYARHWNIPFREDQSNSETVYTRNQIRLEVLPILAKVVPGVSQHLGSTLHRLQDAFLIYSERIEQLRKEMTSGRGKDVYILIRKLRKHPAAESVLYEILKPYGFSAAESGEAWKLCGRAAGSYLSNKAFQLVRHRDFLIITQKISEQTDLLLIETHTELLAVSGGVFHLKRGEGTVHPSSDPNQAFINAGVLNYPLILRRWKTGDYLYPLGLNKKKKVSRLLIDARIPLHEKQKIWVLESNNRLVWIPGLRLDHRFRIDEKTRQYLHIQYTPLEE